MIRILSVDDHPRSVKVIAALVNAESGMQLIADVTNGRKAIESSGGTGRLSR